MYGSSCLETGWPQLGQLPPLAAPAPGRPLYHCRSARLSVFQAGTQQLAHHTGGRADFNVGSSSWPCHTGCRGRSGVCSGCYQLHQLTAWQQGLSQTPLHGEHKQRSLGLAREGGTHNIGNLRWARQWRGDRRGRREVEGGGVLGLVLSGGASTFDQRSAEYPRRLSSSLAVCFDSCWPGRSAAVTAARSLGATCRIDAAGLGRFPGRGDTAGPPHAHQSRASTDGHPLKQLPSINRRAKNNGMPGLEDAGRKRYYSTQRGSSLLMQTCVIITLLCTPQEDVQLSFSLSLSLCLVFVCMCVWHVYVYVFLSHARGQMKQGCMHGHMCIFCVCASVYVRESVYSGLQSYSGN